MSRSSAFEDGKPIRGGVPLIFPWFGARAGHPESPAHGIARLRAWQIDSCSMRADGSARVVLLLNSDESTVRAWSHEFELRMEINVSQTLDMTLEVRNKSAQAMQFEEAMHTYFTVGDVQRMTVDGLDKVEYLDKVDAMKQQDPGRRHPNHRRNRSRVFQYAIALPDQRSRPRPHHHGLERKLQRHGRLEPLDGQSAGDARFWRCRVATDDLRGNGECFGEFREYRSRQEPPHAHADRRLRVIDIRFV